MSRLSDIPEDVWQKAVQHVGTSPNASEECVLVAEAIATERVRCVVAAQQLIGREGGDDFARGYRLAATDILEAIRNPTT